MRNLKKKKIKHMANCDWWNTKKWYIKFLFKF